MLRAADATLRPAAVVGEHVLDLVDAAVQLGDAETAAILARSLDTHEWLTPAGRARIAALLERTGPRAAGTAPWRPAASARFGPPLIRPRKFIATGRNYADHLREGQRLWAARGRTVTQAEHPTAFTKFASTIVGPGDAIVLPAGVDSVDYEIELAVVIGTPAFRVSERDALGCVAGYTICNDVGARAIQRFEMEHQIGLVMAKNFPTFSPLGPWIVTADEIPDPQTLALRLEVNGETRQDATTADMIFSVAALVAYWSRIGLAPGDVISTGTPAGVAVARADPARFYLKPGDHVCAMIDRIGVLENPVVQG